MEQALDKNAQYLLPPTDQAGNILPEYQIEGGGPEGTLSKNIALIQCKEA